MGTLRIPSAHQEFRREPPDLEGAFNDGYELTAEPSGAALRRWAVIGWSVVAWCVGTFMMVESLISGISRLWR